MSKEYKLVDGYTSPGLAQEVTRLMNEGWQCQGGVSTTRSGHETRYHQAMVRESVK